MDTRYRASLLTIVAALAASGVVAPPAGAADDTVTARVKVLLARLGDPKTPPLDHVGGPRDVYDELLNLGAPAAPLLVEAATGPNETLNRHGLRLLQGIGRQGLAAIRAKWPDLNDERRWTLVPILEEFDRESVREYARNCLDSKGPVRLQAWAFHVRARDPLVKERYFQLLEGQGDPELRWTLFTDKPGYDAAREEDVLIGWLKPDSWAAKSEGDHPPPCTLPPWWPDGRDRVIDVLGRRKARRAAPALLELLTEKGLGRAYLGDAILPLLGEFGDKAAVPELKRILATKPDELFGNLSGPEPLRAVTAQSLWRLGDRSGRPLLLEHLKSERWFHRRFAAEAVAESATGDDLAVLAGMLDDADWGVLQAASVGLERVTGVQNRNGNTRPTDDDAPRWKAWLKANR